MRAPGGTEESEVSPPVNSGGAVPVAGETQQSLKKGPWTASEDAILLEYVRKHGEGNWNAVQKNSSLQRCGKSCRLRWANHLRPNLKKGSFSPEEEILILQLHAELGNKWARMAAQLPGRTDNEIKNYWNTRIKRRQRAGLPLYPPEIQRRVAFMNNQRQGSLMILENQPRPKHFFPPVPTAAPAMFGNAGNGHYLMGNVELGLPLPAPIQSSNYSMNLELPSAQFYLDSSSDEKLLPPPALRQGSDGQFDAAFQESQRARELFNHGLFHDNFPSSYPSMAEQPLSSKCSGVDSPCKLGSSDFTVGTYFKNQAAELQQPVNQDLTTLLDMIPANVAGTPTAQILSDWCNSGPSSVVTENDLRLQMQKLASTLSMAHDWGFGSCSWDNIPSIH